ncbi:MAG: hypothetical protein COV91_01855 [Candidatus Taylorbacteria bacterium CG11_big_fil_rev_8_21_14_0_20_46_11]|uniref:Uncharacterized protein n=1 Tax=Candidatus Taylorbacteria bacterium CG11_big_fil_rev_8_21_14_0_20_46_11 TaxID=1975025 RepID=A0A2H0KC93_9BACT|nr:MAG: hypothetical protein COV91_01855 [Candidatus Taylorbacteria bacterium CG11_big_fil_rev_8_21_14_0_20_46_11]
MLTRAQAIKNLKEDAVSVGVSVMLAWFLISSGIIANLLSTSHTGQVTQSFVAGMFFTSAFTIAPASVFLIQLAQDTSMYLVALFGALGAMCGDLIMFLFIRDRFANDLRGFFRGKSAKRFLNSFHTGFWKWLGPLIGGFIIASPLPDEIGISLLGLSKIRLRVLLPVAFVMNFIGILALAGIASVL